MSYMHPDPAITFSEIILRKLKLRSATALSPYVLREARPEIVMDRMADRMVAHLDSHVLGLEETKEYEIVEQPVYPTWRHHLVDSLPEGWRRRFLTHWWSLEGERLGRRTTHTVVCRAHAAFPQAEIQVPKEMGHVVRFAAIDDHPYYDR